MRCSRLERARTIRRGAIGAASVTAGIRWPRTRRDRIALESAVAPAERRRRMAAMNPLFLPRNHLVEEVIAAAVTRDDFQPFHDLVDLLARPTKWRREKARYARPPRPEEVVQRTFCGT
jgi:protein adenylyltransferase